MSHVRVRFAPSPTGGLHLGGVRTVLYNYLFARKHGGTFILRIEDTDQNRYVEGAEQYIYDCLRWCGLEPDESPLKGGPHGPYRQSERKAIYREYAEKLVASGHAYIAFDTPEELEQMRTQFRSDMHSSPQYDARVRKHMKNSLTLSAEETRRLLDAGTPHVIRIKMPENEEVRFTDLIRGEVVFNSSQSDDKVLLKADGMPTYHLAVVVDDKLMEVTHAFRGEEWLPSAPAHILLWRYLGWEKQMPQWAHLPLILKPDGHGKLSKRDGDKLGFPVFAMNWIDPKSGELTAGFRERGFLPEAFINMLALLGWNPGMEQEIFTLDELVQHFSIERVHKGGAKFDYEKAKWFNHEWIKRSSAERLRPDVLHALQEPALGEPALGERGHLDAVIDLVKERCTLIPDFVQQSSFFFQKPKSIETDVIKPKWDEKKASFFAALIDTWARTGEEDATSLEASFKALATEMNIKPGELQQPLRIMLVGGKFGPPVFAIAAILGRQETAERITYVLRLLPV